MIPIRVLGDRVLVALEPKETHVEPSTGMNYREERRSESGLIVLAQPTEHVDIETQTRGIVVALGCDVSLRVRMRSALAGIEWSGDVHEDAACPFCYAVKAGLPACGDYKAEPPETHKECCEWSELMALTEDWAEHDVAVGDCVLFSPSAGQTIPYDGVDYVLLREADILAVVEPVTEAEVV